jgi:DNA adenine methylase
LFAGGLAVSLGRQDGRVLAADPNVGLMSLYRSIRAGRPPNLIQNMDQYRYNDIRTEYNSRVTSTLHAVEDPKIVDLFYNLNKYGFNGLYRVNQNGMFNVPWNKKTTAQASNWPAYQALFKDWTFLVGGFDNIRIQDGDLVFADPPYDDGFDTYIPGGFSWDDQVRLAHKLAAYDGPVVATNKATDRILDLYASLDFTVSTIEAPRRLACNGNRTPALEMIATRSLK